MGRKEPALSSDALRQLLRFPVRDQRRLVDAMRVHLFEEDPSLSTRNKFRLRRPSEHADFELRVEDMRVFYRVHEDAAVTVALIGRKQGARLIVEGVELRL